MSKEPKHSIEKQRVFRIKLFSNCPIYGKLVIKKNEGALKYFDHYGEITTIEKMENYSKIMIQSIISQAEIICLMKYATLKSY